MPLPIHEINNHPNLGWEFKHLGTFSLPFKGPYVSFYTSHSKETRDKSFIFLFSPGRRPTSCGYTFEFQKSYPPIEEENE